MFTINNKLKTVSALILAISSAATLLAACGENSTPEPPVETVIGTQGEILGVSVYTEENENETQTILYELTTKKSKKTKESRTEKSDSSVIESVTELFSNSNHESETRKMTVRNNSSGITLVSRTESESTSRVRPTFPKETTQKTSRVAPTFGNNSEQTTKHVPVSYVPENEPPKASKKPMPTTVKHTQAVTKADSKPVYDEKISEESLGINIVFITDSVENGSSASVMIQGKPGERYSIDFYISPTETANISALEDKTADENGFVSWSFSIPMSCEPGNKKVIIKDKNSSDYAQTSIEIR